VSELVEHPVLELLIVDGGMRFDATLVVLRAGPRCATAPAAC